VKLIYEKSAAGRRGYRPPAPDVEAKAKIPAALLREKPAAMPEVSELDVVRHFTALSQRNFGLDTGFYPLGSCTMKYNPKMAEAAARTPGLADLHPMLAHLPEGETLIQGALEILYETDRWLREICGMAAFTTQPLAGAHGELTGVLMMAAYHAAKGNDRRTILIPDSAHGTNPASATLAGYRVTTIPSDASGATDIAAVAAALGKGDVAGIMLTCPDTLGLFHPQVQEICRMVHEADAVAYCDGANLNALLGRCRPGDLGFDLLHVNLHKTFATPHGGGGPGAGPVGVSPRLVDFLPVPRIGRRADGTFFLDSGHPKSIGQVAPFFGNFGVIVRAYAYMRMLGREGLRRVSENAVLNANYLREKLKGYYDLPPPLDRRCMHECVFSASRQVKRGVRALDIAKALIDRGFHPPTIYFPLVVKEALMIEPTETESKETLDAFIEAMIEIAQLAETNPEAVTSCPKMMPVGRLDETRAARQPDLAWLG
jgi:glycine dehydrogenase subunit 2